MCVGFYLKLILLNISPRKAKSSFINLIYLSDIRMFYLTFPIWSAVRAELSWTHYRLLLSLEDEKARDSYINEAIEGNWSTRQLESIICHLILKAHTVYAELTLMRIYIRNVDKSYRLEWRNSLLLT